MPVDPLSSSAQPAGATGSTSPTSTGSPDSKGKSSNTGPIVGGIVAGIAVVAIAVLGFFYLRRRRTRPQYAAPPSSFGAGDDLFGGGPQPQRESIKGPSSDGHHTSSSVPTPPMRMYVRAFVPPLLSVCASSCNFFPSFQDPNDPTTFPSLQTPYTPSASPRAIYGPQQDIGSTLVAMQVTRPHGYHCLPTV